MLTPAEKEQTAREALLRAVQKLDKRAQILAVDETKDGKGYRVTLLKDGKSGTAAIKKETVEAFLAGGEKAHELTKALGRAVSHLSIRYGK